MVPLMLRGLHETIDGNKDPLFVRVYNLFRVHAKRFILGQNNYIKKVFCYNNIKLVLNGREWVVHIQLQPGANIGPC